MLSDLQSLSDLNITLGDCYINHYFKRKEIKLKVTAVWTTNVHLESGTFRIWIQVFLTTKISAIFKTNQLNEMTVNPVVGYLIYLLITWINYEHHWRPGSSEPPGCSTKVPFPCRLCILQDWNPMDHVCFWHPSVTWVKEPSFLCLEDVKLTRRLSLSSSSLSSQSSSGNKHVHR